MLEFTNSGYSKQIVPIDGSIRILQFIKDIERKMIVVTGRGNHLREMTAHSVRNHFNGYFSGIYHARGYVLDEQIKKKSEICIEQGVNLIFDDDPKHIIDCVGAGIKVIVRDQPWNQARLPDGAFRMKSCYEIPRILYEITK
jgi:hypothetical protein